MRFKMDNSAPLVERLDTLHWISVEIIAPPSDLIEFSAGDIIVFAGCAPSARWVAEFRHAARIDPDKYNRHSTNPPCSIQPRFLSQSNRASGISESAIARANRSARSDIDTDADFDKAAPMAKIRPIAGEGVIRLKYCVFSIPW